MKIGLTELYLLKIHYDDLATASDAVRNGKVVGVFHINKNISVSMETRINSSPLDFEDLNETEIDVYLDMSSKLDRSLVHFYHSLLCFY